MNIFIFSLCVYIHEMILQSDFCKIKRRHMLLPPPPPPLGICCSLPLGQIQIKFAPFLLSDKPNKIFTLRVNINLWACSLRWAGLNWNLWALSSLGWIELNLLAYCTPEWAGFTWNLWALTLSESDLTGICERSPEWVRLRWNLWAHTWVSRIELEFVSTLR